MSLYPRCSSSLSLSQSLPVPETKILLLGWAGHLSAVIVHTGAFDDTRNTTRWKAPADQLLHICHDCPLERGDINNVYSRERLVWTKEWVCGASHLVQEYIGGVFGGWLCLTVILSHMYWGGRWFWGQQSRKTLWPWGDELVAAGRSSSDIDITKKQANKQNSSHQYDMKTNMKALRNQVITQMHTHCSDKAGCHCLPMKPMNDFRSKSVPEIIRSTIFGPTVPPPLV